MENDITARAEQLGREADGLHYFVIDERLSNPTISEVCLGTFCKVEVYDEEVYLIFESKTLKVNIAFSLSDIEKLLSGEVLEFQTSCRCKDRATLEARIEREREEERKMKIREKIDSVDWEARTWEIFSALYANNFISSHPNTTEFLIKEAREVVEQYKQSMKEKV